MNIEIFLGHLSLNRTVVAVVVVSQARECQLGKNAVAPPSRSVLIVFRITTIPTASVFCLVLRGIVLQRIVSDCIVLQFI